MKHITFFCTTHYLTKALSLLLIVIALFTAFYGSDLYAQKIEPISLTTEITASERLWLDNNQPITVAVDAYFPPYSYLDENQKMVGISIDTLDLISQKLSANFVIVNQGRWQSIYVQLKNHHVDIIPTMVQTTDREKVFHFTTPYIFKSLVIITHKNNKLIKKRADIQNHTVAIVKGYQYGKRILTEFPSVTPLYVDNMYDALLAVETKQADAAISYIAASNYLQEKYQFTQLKFADYYDKNSANESIAVSLNKPILASILQKAINSLTAEEKAQINTRWGATIVPPKDYSEIIKLILASMLIITLILLWLFQVKRHNKRLTYAKCQAEAANGALSKLKENLEHEVALRTHQLTSSEHKYRGLVESLQDEYIFFQNDITGNIIYVSPSVMNILGYLPSEFNFHYNQITTGASCNDKIEGLVQRCMDGEKLAPFEIEVLAKNGSVHTLELLVRLVHNEEFDIPCCEGIAHDITHQKVTQDRLNWLSYYDDLTGLANRRLFLFHLEKAIAYANGQQQNIAVLFLDLNRFKYVNDNLGHGAGDIVLKQTAQRLMNQLREYDTASRFGGDEFCVILPDTTGEDAFAIAQRIISELTQPFEINQQRFVLGASIGISRYPLDGNDCDSLLKQADTAMYSAKKTASHVSFCSAEQMIVNHRNMLLEQGLHYILSQPEKIIKQQLSLHYQPIYNIFNGHKKHHGFEALIRWSHPTLGAISPAEFIPIAEERNMISQISHWVLTQACIQAKDWHQKEFEFGKISINLSAYELININLAEQIISTIESYDISSKWIKIEVTETALLQSPEIAIQTLTKLSHAGLCVVIDDFGTGYSSLSYLKKLPASIIKIDQSFIQNITTSIEDQAVVQAIISMSHSLGKKVTAEGVETEAQLAFLIDHQCDKAQGYLFYKPMPAREVEHLFISQELFL